MSISFPVRESGISRKYLSSCLMTVVMPVIVFASFLMNLSKDAGPFFGGSGFLAVVSFLSVFSVLSFFFPNQSAFACAGAAAYERDRRQAENQRFVIHWYKIGVKIKL